MNPPDQPTQHAHPLHDAAIAQALKCYPPTPYAHEWRIIVKADEPAGAIDALFNCIRSFQSGAEPIGGTCPASMGNRMTYDVSKDGRPTPTPDLAPTPTVVAIPCSFGVRIIRLPQTGSDSPLTSDEEIMLSLHRELAAAKAECERLKSARWKYADDPEMVFTDDWGWLHITTKAGIDEGVAELARLRAEVEKLTIADHAWRTAAKFDAHNAEVLKAENELTQAKLVDREEWLKQAEATIESLRAEVERLTECRRVDQQSAKNQAARAERAEAERDALAKDKAQLNDALAFIVKYGGMTVETECGEIKCTGFWCAEQALAAMKGTQ